MILEENDAATIARPVTLPRGIGGVHTLGPDIKGDQLSVVSFQSIIASDLALIPPSARVGESWTPVDGRPRALQIFIGEPVSAEATPAAKRLICSLSAMSLPNTTWSGLYSAAVTAVVKKSPGILNHEYGHHVDWMWRAAGDYTPVVSGTQNNITSTRGDLIQAIERAWPGIDANAYGKTNYREWFAEMFALQTNVAWTAGFTRGLWVLSGRSNEIAGHIRALFLEMFPDLPRYSWATDRIAPYVVNGAEVGPFVPCVTGRDIPTLSLGTPFSRQFISEVAESVTWTIASGSLPPGLTLNGSTGVIAGTPTAGGTYSFTLRAANSAGQTDRAFTTTVFDPSMPIPTITTTSVIIDAGVAVNVQLAATGASPISWSLPTVGKRFADYPPLANLSLSSSGVITGTSNGGQTSAQKVVVRASAPGGYTDREIYVRVATPTGFRTSSLPALTVGAAVNSVITFYCEKPGSIQLTAGSLPAGLTLSGADNDAYQPNDYNVTLTGTPTTAGAYSFTLTATGSTGQAASATFSGQVAAAS